MKYNIIMLGRFSHSYARQLRHNSPPDYATAKNAQSKRIDTLENREAILQLLSRSPGTPFSAEEIASTVLQVPVVRSNTILKFRRLLNTLVNETGSRIMMINQTHSHGPVTNRQNAYFYQNESPSPDAMGVDAEEHDGE